MRAVCLSDPSGRDKELRYEGFQAALFCVFPRLVGVRSAFPLGCSEEPLSQNLGSEQMFHWEGGGDGGDYI